MNKLFAKFAQKSSDWSGKSYTFVVAIFVIILWAATGHYFQYSDTWQLIINTGTTIITFLMVFLIQNAQNRATLAMQAKMDEILRATKDARNSFIGVEDMDEQELAEVKRHLARYREDRNVDTKYR